MAGNTIGTLFRLTTFGESHGKAIGGIIDGCPAGISIDMEQIQQALDRRKPGQSDITTARKEEDKVEILSGIFEGKTLGTPIGFIIPNKDQNPADYDHLKDIYRPSHADYVYQKKYGIRDHRGGGRSSARETACRVVGGAVARHILQHYSIQVIAYTSSIGNLKFTGVPDHSQIYSSPTRCPDKVISDEMESLILRLKAEGDSIGGVVSCIIKNVPVGLGDPVFDKLSADLAKAMLSINAVKGFELGEGFSAVGMTGSGHNDLFGNTEGSRRATNHAGGIDGGISNGEDILFRVAFKPASTIQKTQPTFNNMGEKVEFEGKGRHDPSVVPRAVPVVQAMAEMVVADHLLRQRVSSI